MPADLILPPTVDLGLVACGNRLFRAEIVQTGSTPLPTELSPEKLRLINGLVQAQLDLYSAGNRSQEGHFTFTGLHNISKKGLNYTAIQGAPITLSSQGFVVTLYHYLPEEDKPKIENLINNLFKYKAIPPKELRVKDVWDMLVEVLYKEKN